VPRIFALADLHLSLVGAKPMDIFGEAWRDHPRQMAEAWDRQVTAEDVVLLPGDISWGRTLEEARPDLEWIHGRPGRKLLLRGNHDGWWSSPTRVREALPEGCHALQNDSHPVLGWVVVGARGWLLPDDPQATAQDRRVFQRELERLRLSILHADRTHGRVAPRLAMLHYPPWLVGQEPSPVVDLLRRAGVSVVVYGHLHGKDHALALRGVHDGLRFCFVAADAVGFAPVDLGLDPC
jgi:predicted phosphohydrolase